MKRGVRRLRLAQELRQRRHQRSGQHRRSRSLAELVKLADLCHEVRVLGTGCAHVRKRDGPAVLRQVLGAAARKQQRQLGARQAGPRPRAVDRRLELEAQQAIGDRVVRTEQSGVDAAVDGHDDVVGDVAQDRQRRRHLRGRVRGHAAHAEGHRRRGSHTAAPEASATNSPSCSTTPAR